MDTRIPTSMYAWRKHKGNPEPVWEEVPVPEVPSTGFLCKILASGVCHSDHSLLTNEAQRPWFQEKYTLGHEGCGEIIEIGDNVTDASFKIGDRIALLSVPGCGSDFCDECSRDLAQLCQAGHHSGIGQDGFYAPFAVVDQRGAIKLLQGSLLPSLVTEDPLADDGPGVSPAEGAVATDAVTTAYHAITRRGEVKAKETVFLFGLGGLGFNALQIIMHIGARVIVSDIRQERLDEAAKLGVPAEDLVPAGVSVQDFVKQKGLEGKIDTVLDFVGTHQTFEDGQGIVRIGGKIVCVGTLDLDNTVHMKVGVRKRLSIIFSYGGQARDLEAVLHLMSKNVLRPQVETGRLQDFPQVLRDLCNGKVKGRMALLQG